MQTHILEAITIDSRRDGDEIFYDISARADYQFMSLNEQELQILFCIAFPQYIRHILYREEPSAKDYREGDILMMDKDGRGGWHYARISKVTKGPVFATVTMDYLTGAKTEVTTTFRNETILHPVYRVKSQPAKL